MTSARSVICNVLNAAKELCCLCCNEVENDFIRIHDEVFLPETLNIQTIEFQELVAYILGNEITDLLSPSEAVCKQCTHSCIQSYIFIRRCKENYKTMSHTLQTFLSKMESFPSGYKSVVFAFDGLKGIVNVCYFNRKRNIRKQTLLKKLQFNGSAMKNDGNSLYLSDEHEQSTVSKEQEIASTAAKGKKMYKCKICYHKTMDRLSLMAHLKEQHSHHKVHKRSRSDLKLKICKIVLDGKKRKYECRICCTRYKKYQNLQHHFIAQHKSSLKDCDSMQILSRSPKKEKPFTLIEVNKTKRFECNFCHNVFIDILTAEDHYDNVHGSSNIKEVANDVKLDPKVCTIVIENNVQRYNCNLCYKSFKYAKTMSNHYLQSHSGKADGLICSICGKTFKYRVNLKNHEIIHTQSSVTCPICKRSYKSYYYKLHICNTSNHRLPRNKQFTCDICNKMFATKASIRCHIRYRHMDTRLVCPWCGKKCAAQSILREHIVVHTREKNFKCEMCNGKFVSKQSLKLHMRLHTGERPFACEKCDKTFLSASRRTEHDKRKHREKPQPQEKCDICNKMYTNRDILKRHRKRHFTPNSSLFVEQRPDSAG